jgi:predicted phage terminase large subunit-like protein
MQIDKPKYFGKLLLDKGFRVWFKYMFYTIEGNKFIEEPLHADLFGTFENIYAQIDTRVSLNSPPRSGKTTMATYFMAYCWAKNAKSNFIYTSFSQSLLSDIARAFANILEHPVYKAMYDLNVTHQIEEVSPIDEFWKSYLIENEGLKVAKYSSRKVVSPSGGIILFASIGSAITGFGAGLRNSHGFTGALIVDDGNKPADMHSEVMRNKVVTYFEETLLSRLNNPDVAIINIQQRLHLRDLTGMLNEKYKYKTLIKPLMIGDVCQLPSQYTPERIDEIKVNDYMFKAQYQQEPIQHGGTVFKLEWWQYYSILPKLKYTKIYADTALKTKEHNDYSVFQLWGVGYDGNMYLIDQLRGKWEAHDLERQAKSYWAKHKGYSPRSFAIEDKASGTGLIQNLRARHGIPVEARQVDKDKYTRAMDIQPHIQSGFVYIPENADFVSDFLNEFSSFSPLMTHAHDDQIDTAMHAIDDMRVKTDVSIFDVL